MLFPGFCVDLSGYSRSDYVVYKRIGKPVIPILVFDSGLEMRGVVADFVEMADYVEAAGVNHIV